MGCWLVHFLLLVEWIRHRSGGGALYVKGAIESKFNRYLRVLYQVCPVTLQV